MKQFLLCATEDKYLTFETVCTGLDCEITLAEDLASAADEMKTKAFDTVFLPGTLEAAQLLVDTNNKPGKVVFLVEDKNSMAKGYKLISYHHLTLQVISTEFTPRENSEFARIVHNVA